MRSRVESIFTLVLIMILILPRLNEHSTLFKKAFNPRKRTENTHIFPQALSLFFTHLNTYLMFRITFSISVHLSIQSQHFYTYMLQRSASSLFDLWLFLLRWLHTPHRRAGHFCHCVEKNEELYYAFTGTRARSLQIYSLVRSPLHQNDEHAPSNTVLTNPNLT